MKKKLMGLGLVLSLGLAGAVLAVSFNPVVATHAVDSDDGHTWGLIGSFSGNSWSSDVATSSAYNATTGTKTITYGIQEGTTFKIRADSAWTVTLNSTILTQGRTGGNTYFEDDGTTDKNLKVKSGCSGQYTFTLQGNLYNYEDKSYGVTVAYSAATSYTVVEMAKMDSAEPVSLASETALSTQAFTPTRIAKKNYVFGGWYTDAACTSAYTATILSADTTLYAKYTTASGTTNVYFGASGWTDIFVYTFGTSETLGSFPGTQTEATAAIANVNYNGKGLYKIAIPTGEGGDTKVIFSNCIGGVKQTQTADLVLTEGAYYTSEDAADSTGSTSLGSGASLVCQTVSTISGTTNVSVCEVTKANATTLYESYQGLDSTAKAAVDVATLYTWKDANRVTEEKLNVSFASVFAQLGTISSASGAGGAAMIIGDNNSAWAPAWIALISLSVAALASAGLLISRRKHE